MRKEYAYLCEKALLPLADLTTGRSIAKKLRFLDTAQWWRKEKLRDYQDRQIASVVRYAYDNTLYFRRIMDERGITPGIVNSVADLEMLPVMNKTVIREHGIDSFLATDRRRLIKSSTSGSTGEPRTVYLSKEAQSLTYAAELLFFKWGGFRLGDRHILTGATTRRGIQKAVKDIVFRCHYFSAFNLSDSELEKLVSLIRNREVRILAGYASSLFCLASYVARREEKIELEAVISFGDTLYGHYRNLIERVFGSAVTDVYGCAEGFQIAGQCAERRYHVCMPLNYVEILDDNGKRLPPGKTGRVVVTRLDLNPMPMIRYEVGDLAGLSREDVCACGRTWLLLDGVLGRDTDVVITPNGHRLIVHFFTVIFQDEPSVRQFQVLQEKSHEICISVVPADNFTEEVLEVLKGKILERCEGDLRVNFRIVKDIPSSKSGKRRFVISRVKSRNGSRRTLG